MIQTENDPTSVDDRDYHGNKCMELAGSLQSFLLSTLDPLFQIGSSPWLHQRLRFHPSGLLNKSGLHQLQWWSSMPVAWVRVDTHSILTIHNKVITRNYRIGLAQADGRNRDLKISNVAESDKGFYMCQINTDPMHYQEAYIEVVVPPDIIYSESSTDTIIREGSNVSLTCTGSGHPQPHILWRREDSASITRGKLKSNSFDGEVLVLPRVSRLHIGAYLCIASNGVPPSVSIRLVLNVQFAPVLWIPNQLEGTVVGQQVSNLQKQNNFVSGTKSQRNKWPKPKDTSNCRNFVHGGIVGGWWDNTIHFILKVFCYFYILLP
ncbi:hypothetical protein GHT06_000612 [Daphnia sinensis]|uniref:Ig-like domain-containing protein n=1 Tax=Daphnia sinensis TaxID=1820382 RepID=A0AAD5KEL0_9CRUS|nr:hypothetical protein GHT06_000612 [Daphnia sinensis]